MMIVGIDPSLTATAIVAGRGTPPVTGDTYDTFDKHTFRSKPLGKSCAERIERYTALLHRIAEWTYQIGARGEQVSIYLEGYSYASSASQGRALAEFGGLLREHLVLWAGRRVYEVAPATLKKFATGKGNASKSVVGAHLAKRYGVLFDSDDLYDAYALYQLGLCCEGVCEPQTKAQREACEVVRGAKQ